MQQLMRGLITTLLVLAVGGYAFAELTVKTVSSEKAKPSVTKERMTTAIATVEAIDLEKRIVTLKNAEGKIFDIKVGPQARNLPQLKKGDEVTVKYYEAVSAKVYKAGEAPKVAAEAAVLERAKEGEKPGGVLAVQSTITATIDAIDLKKPTVTLKNAEGKYLTVKIEDRKNLENVKVGDEVVITYAEAVAISVQKTKKSKK
jgi:Cu/Ag efflux protein CusF